MKARSFLSITTTNEVENVNAHQEIELKLMYTGDGWHAVRHQLQQLTGLSDYSLKPPHQFTITDVFYDTPDYDLLAKESILRIRKTPQKTAICVKHKEQQTSGVFSRREVETELTRSGYELIHCELSSVNVSVSISDLQLIGSGKHTTGLIPLLTATTDRTERKLLKDGTTVALLVIDEVQYDGHNDTICNIEIELVDGTRDDLAKLSVAIDEAFPGQWSPAKHSKFYNGLLITGKITT